MPKSIPRQEVIKAVIEGLNSARKQYDHIAGEYLRYAPEYFAGVHIFQAMHKRFSKRDTNAGFITMEGMYRDVGKSAKAVQRGRKHKVLPSNSRPDIVLWWGNEQPRAALELKTSLRTYGAAIKDIEKLCAMLNRGKETSSIQFGALAIYTDTWESELRRDKSPAEALLRRWEKLLVSAKAVIEENGCKLALHDYKSGHLVDGESEQWLAGCLIIERKRP